MTLLQADPPEPAPLPPFPLPLPAQWSSPLWWAAILNFLVQEGLAVLTMFHATGWITRLSSVSQGEIVMLSQTLAVVGFLIYGWIHHQQIKAVAAMHQSFNLTVGQIHYNNAVAATERFRLGLEAPRVQLSVTSDPAGSAVGA